MNPEKINLVHSRYNPQGEADRYVNSLSFDERIRFFILIEPGLGYMIAPLKKKFPGVKIIALHAAESGSVKFGHERPIPEWNPGMGISVQDFLENEIPDSPAAELRILEWRPAMSVYGSSYLALVEETAAFIKRSDANARTLKGFGRSWFRNFFKNIGLLQNVLLPVPFSMPLLVTGAGPSLENSLPLIKEREKFFILASSSSAAALHTGGFSPDMVISTDGGHWAVFHLNECLRRWRPAFKLAASLTAALPSQSGSLPILPISDGSLWQILVLKELGIPFVTLPQRGTVSASALDLAFALTKGEVYIAGIDLANRDISTHARPYALDFLQEEKVTRTNPFYTQSFRRSSQLKAGGSYTIYASWFEKQIKKYPGQLRSLGENNPLFNGREFPHPANTSESSAVSPEFRIITLHHREDPSSAAIKILEKALRESAYSQKLREELATLLFPGENTPSDEDLTSALRRHGKGNR